MMTPPERRPGRRFFHALALLVAVVGCGGERHGSRATPFPRLEPRAPFPTLGESGPDLPDAGGSFEARARRASRAEDPVPSTDSTQTLPLADLLSAELPAEGGWTWSADQGTLLAVHRSAEEAALTAAPDALILTRVFSVTSPIGLQAAAFHHGVAAENPSVLPLGPQWRHLWARLQREGVPRDGSAVPDWLTDCLPDANDLERLTVLRQLESPTLGRGLGFHPAENGFEGFRWVGRNENRVEVRLGRYTGRWSRPLEPDDRLRRALACRAEVESTDGPAPPRVTPRDAPDLPGHLLVGTVRLRRATTGVHLAILWTASRRPVEEDLAAFLASIREADNAPRMRRMRQRGWSEVGNLAADAGLELQP
jgi:hypothetical protein